MTTRAADRHESRSDERQRDFRADPRYAVSATSSQGWFWAAWRDYAAFCANTALASGFASTHERALVAARAQAGRAAMALPAQDGRNYRRYLGQKRRATAAAPRALGDQRLSPETPEARAERLHILDEGAQTRR
jgi:hypothetical protein